MTNNNQPNPINRQNKPEIIAERHIFAGPIPPPSILQEYSKIIPDAPERILKMAEKQSQHRIEIEQKVIEADIKGEKRGSIFAFIMIVLLLIFAGVCIYKNLTAAGITIILGEILGIAGLFIYKEYKNKDNK